MDNPIVGMSLKHHVNSQEIADRASVGRFLWFRKHALPPPATLLDVGCGHIQLAASTFGEYRPDAMFSVDEDVKSYVLGVEGNSDFVSQVRQHFGLSPKIINCIIGQEHIPLGDNSFNTVQCGETMEHIPKENWHYALSELWRVTKNVLLISIPDDPGELHPDDFALESHSYAPDIEELTDWIQKVCTPDKGILVQKIIHVTEPRPLGFRYVRAIKQRWW